MARRTAPKAHIEGAEQPRVASPEQAHTAAPEQPRTAAPEQDMHTAQVTQAEGTETTSAEASEQGPKRTDEAPTSEATANDPQEQAAQRVRPKNPLAWLPRVLSGHEHAALGGLCGLLIAVLVFVVGFWRTLFVTVLVVVGVAVGQYLDGDPRLVKLVRKVLAELRGSEH